LIARQQRICESTIILVLGAWFEVSLSCLWGWNRIRLVLDSVWAILSITHISRIKCHVPLLECW